MIAVALFFAGMALGIALAFALIRAERTTPSPQLRTRPRPVSSSSGAPRVGAPSHCRPFRDPPRKSDGSSYYLWDLEL